MQHNPFVFSKQSVLLMTLLIIILSARATASPSFHTSGTTSNIIEDQIPVFVYNFSANVTNPENATLTYSIEEIKTAAYNFSSIALYYWIKINATTGLLTFNATLDNETGNFNLSVHVVNEVPEGQTRVFYFNVSAINDAPTFTNALNKTFNMTQQFDYTLQINDEENNIPFRYNLTFLNCKTAAWSNRNNTNCQLFNSSYYTTNVTAGRINISFIPTRNDVGSYILNITVIDAGTISPVNASQGVVLNFTVLEINQKPYFTYVCDNERNATEKQVITCYINASDVGEENNLTFSANATWFLGTTTVRVNVSTGYIGAALVNFTPDNTRVGNTSINISVYDSAMPVLTNTTIIALYVANVDDNVSINTLSNFTIYIGTNYTVFFNATDDDLRIPDKTVYNESISFSFSTACIQITAITSVAQSNQTAAQTRVDPKCIGVGNLSVNVSVHDLDNYSSSYATVFIKVLNNSAPQWISGTKTSYLLTEDAAFSLNLTQNITDSDGPVLTFSYTNTTSFPSFSLNASTSIITLTPVDGDIGEHIVTIIASDSVVSTPINFNFTVQNINDAPSISTPLAVNQLNASVNGGSNIFTAEDNTTIITMQILDDDLKIPIGQRNFYNESHNVSVLIKGHNSALFNFTLVTQSLVGISVFTASFLPVKADVGLYNVTINVTDRNGTRTSMQLNLTIYELQHAPVLTKITNITSAINESLYIDFNATDTEEGNESTPGSNITYRITNLTTSGNFLTINQTTGIINISFNRSNEGVWVYNISVNDSSGLMDWQIFLISVYGYPQIISPASNVTLYLVENSSVALQYIVNDTVSTLRGENVTYSLSLRNSIRNTTTTIANGSIVNIAFTPNMTDETTCTGLVNVTLTVANTRLSNTSSWSTMINHTTAPVNFIATIGGADKKLSGTSSITLNISAYARDIDSDDLCYNQSLSFAYSLIALVSGSVNVAITNQTNGSAARAVFSSDGAATANYTLIAFEHNTTGDVQRGSNATSNYFIVEITAPTATTTNTGSSGGGSHDVVKLTYLKIITPKNIVKSGGKISIPITVQNTGSIVLKEINLTAYISKDGVRTTAFPLFFDFSYISELLAGQSQNVTLFADINTSTDSLFDIIVYANTTSPKYSDWSNIIVNIQPTDKIQEQIVFTEEFIASNPECIELKELVKEAEEAYKNKNFELANAKTTEALETCKRAIAQRSSLRLAPPFVKEERFWYILIAIAIPLGVWLMYLIYARVKFGASRLRTLRHFS